jgi:hypothetical protein
MAADAAKVGFTVKDSTMQSVTYTATDTTDSLPLFNNTLLLYASCDDSERTR